MNEKMAQYHLPGLFEFYELYAAFLPLYRVHREYFYDWCEIGSIYGAPIGCLWGGGRVSSGTCGAWDVLALMREYGISARLTFSNSLLREEHLKDRTCNALCRLFSESGTVQNGVIVHSELLLDHLKTTYPQLYFVSSTTKVLTDFSQLRRELERPEFSYVVPDFRLNKAFSELNALPQVLKDKVEFLCNECCWFGCKDRRACLRGRQSEKSRRNRPGAPLQSTGRKIWLPLFPRHGKSGLHRHRGHSKYVPSDGLFQFQNRRPRARKRFDSGISALLPDETGLPAARPGRNLFG